MLNNYILNKKALRSRNICNSNHVISRTTGYCPRLNFHLAGHCYATLTMTKYLENTHLRFASTALGTLPGRFLASRGFLWVARVSCRGVRFFGWRAFPVVACVSLAWREFPGMAYASLL